MSNPYKTKEQALRRGNAVLRKMNGNGWKVSVHENLGWYFRVECGAIRVYEDEFKGKITYSVLMSDSMEGAGGSYDWVDKKSYKDPNRAVREQLRRARAYVDYKNQLVSWHELMLKGTTPANKNL